MRKLFKRESDGKLFKTIQPGHWSLIRADDGEEDHVKFYSVRPDQEEEYISASKGHTYLVVE